MHPRKIQVRALRGWHFKEWRWIWLCHQHHVGFPCENWETAMNWVDYHLKKEHR